MSEKAHHDLNLDPGLPQVRRRFSFWSGCKCLFWISCFLPSTLVAVLVVALLYYAFLFIFPPHNALYPNPTLLTCQPDCVVRPLIDAQQTFDIAVTVWVRATEEEEENFRLNYPWEARVSLYVIHEITPLISLSMDRSCLDVALARRGISTMRICLGLIFGGPLSPRK